MRLAGATPVLTALRTAATEAAQVELDRLARRLEGVDGTVRREIDRSVRRIVDKALHQPTVLVRELAADPDGARHIAAFTRLFAAAEAEGGAGSSTPNGPNPPSAQNDPHAKSDPNAKSDPHANSDPNAQNDPHAKNDPNAQNETKIEAIA